ncbi:hypothetical protein GG344DRAFT_67558, partial [Lentinula edodes]
YYSSLPLMRLYFAYLTTIALVSFAYAAPVVRRKHGPFPVKNVTVVYDPNDMLKINQEDPEACMINLINHYMMFMMSPTCLQASKESFHFEKTTSEEKKTKGTAEFSIEVLDENEEEEEKKEKEGKPPKTTTYKGGRLLYNAVPMIIVEHTHKS